MTKRNRGQQKRPEHQIRMSIHFTGPVLDIRGKEVRHLTSAEASWVLTAESVTIGGSDSAIITRGSSQREDVTMLVPGYEIRQIDVARGLALVFFVPFEQVRAIRMPRVGVVVQGDPGEEDRMVFVPPAEAEAEREKAAALERGEAAEH